MSDSIHGELVALGKRWRATAKTFMAEAEQAQRGADMVRLTAMASTLEWAAGDLSVYTRTEPSTALVLTAETAKPV